jgi:hypothetical protein
MSDQGAWTQLSNCKKEQHLLYWICSRSNSEMYANSSDSGRCLVTFERVYSGMSWRQCSGDGFLQSIWKSSSGFPKLFYSTPHPSNTGTGLHAIPLLLQGPRLNPAQKTVWNIPISKSADLGIRRWLEVKARESKRGEWYELLICEDYAKLWHELVPKI